jgi:hypothetical protein
MLASTLGIEFDVDKSYDEKKEIYKISGKIVRTTNITQSAEGNKRGSGLPWSPPQFFFLTMINPGTRKIDDYNYFRAARH